MKNLKVIYEVLLTKFRANLSNFSREMIRKKHNVRSDVCFVFSTEKGKVTFNTESTHGVIDSNKIDVIRRMVGENVLSTYGLPTKEDQIPVIHLIITPSFIFEVGLEKTIEFYNNWEGNSTVKIEKEDVIVIKYT